MNVNSKEIFNRNIEQLKKRVSINDILKHYGMQQHKNQILCPFHNDKNPSCHIYPDSNSFYCFTCGAGGDIINFVAEQEKVKLGRAAEMVNDWFNCGLDFKLISEKQIINYYKLTECRNNVQKWSESAYKKLTVYANMTSDTAGKETAVKWLDILLNGSNTAKKSLYMNHNNDIELYIGLVGAMQDDLQAVEMPKNYQPIYISDTDYTFFDFISDDVEIQKMSVDEEAEPDAQLNVENQTVLTAENILNPATYAEIFDMTEEFEISSYIQQLRQQAKKMNMVKEFDSITRAIEKQAIKQIKEIHKQQKIERLQQKRSEFNYPEWIALNGYGNLYINEPAFVDDYIRSQELKCINGKFYNINGYISDAEIEHNIQSEISKYIVKNIAQLTRRLSAALKNTCYSDDFNISDKEIHVLNGVLYVDGSFVPEKRFCANRINVDYNTNAEAAPKKWLDFISNLLIPDDIPTLQEYLGYCLIPTLKAQSMLFIIGNGGEGKSVIGDVLRVLYGRNMKAGKLNRIQKDRFFTANLEGKLLFVDDDLDFEALPDTGKVKEIVTNEYQDVENKGVQSYDTRLYARLLCFGNGAINSLHDKTNGFYRRQIIIKTKPKQEDRIDNVHLADELIEQELQPIFNWCFAGLQRLIRNGYKFTISEQAKQNLKDVQEENFNFISFLRDADEVIFDADAEAATVDLCAAYEMWCNRNALTMYKRSTVTKYLKDNAGKYKVICSNHCRTSDGKEARGFKGVKIVRKYTVI